jgi:hypothetical protein
MVLRWKPPQLQKPAVRDDRDPSESPSETPSTTSSSFCEGNTIRQWVQMTHKRSMEDLRTRLRSRMLLAQQLHLVDVTTSRGV